MTVIIRPKLTDRQPITHCKVIALLHRFHETDEKFIAYLDFVFQSWLGCKDAAMRYFPNWLLSEKMIARFEELQDKQTLHGDSISNDLRATYSDHTYAGVSDDVEFDTGSIVWNGTNL